MYVLFKTTSHPPLTRPSLFVYLESLKTFFKATGALNTRPSWQDKHLAIDDKRTLERCSAH